MATLTPELWYGIVKGLKASYRNFLEDAETVEWWYKELSKLPYETVARVAQDHILTSPFPPAICDFFAPQRLTGVQAWQLVEKAMRNSTYHAEEEYNKLPLDVQKAIGGASALRSWGMMENATSLSVLRTQFVRDFEAGQGQTLIGVDNGTNIQCLPRE